MKKSYHKCAICLDFSCHFSVPGPYKLTIFLCDLYDLCDFALTLFFRLQPLAQLLHPFLQSLEVLGLGDLRHLPRLLGLVDLDAQLLDLLA